MAYINPPTVSQYVFKPLVFQEVGGILQGHFSKRPEKRSGHRVVCDDANMYSFGGYLRHESSGSVQHRLLEELWCFNFAEGSWKLLPTTGKAPKELASHCAALYGNYLYVFGGTGIDFGLRSSNTLYACDLRTLVWREVRAYGDVPDPQYGQGFLLDDDARRLIVIGGTTGFGYTMDVHEFAMRSKEWKLLYRYSGSIRDPTPRYRHEIAFDGEEIFVFGGGTSTSSFKLKDVPAFNLARREWRNIETTRARTPASLSSSLEAGEEEEEFPKSRKCHASVKVGTDVYISGGCDGNVIYNDIWKFNLVSETWQLLPSRIPIPLAFHAACVTSEGCMYSFGGVTDLENSVRTNKVFKTWLRVPKLKEISWEAVLHYADGLKIKEMSFDEMVEMGVPAEFAKRAHPNPPGGKSDIHVEQVWESEFLKYKDRNIEGESCCVV